MDSASPSSAEPPAPASSRHSATGREQSAPQGPPRAGDSLVVAALKILNEPDPLRKADYTCATAALWRDGGISCVRPAEWQHLRAPDRPARADDKVRVCAPGETVRRGNGGTLASRQSLLHAAVHIENWAVDLSWDIVARFGLQFDDYSLPREFFDDFVRVAEDECRHFTLLAKRLEELGSHYGAFPVHDGLWESASATAASLPARLAVEQCVHEARGLDVLPATVRKFENGGDVTTAALLRDVVYPEEVAHCAAGVRWLTYLFNAAHGRAPERQEGPDVDAVGDGLGQLQVAADGGHAQASQGAAAASDAAADVQEQPWASDARRHERVEQWFHSLVRANFYGTLKPPFNEAARTKAGFGPEWYIPLASEDKQLAAKAH